MLEVLYIIVMMLFLFGITIFVHEWGHFIVAKKCGLVIETFSIGMGPALWKKEIDGIVYKIGALPIGGYVSIPQLDPSGMEKMQGENENDSQTLPEVSPWKKIAVSAAGPLCNIVFAVVIAWIIFLCSNQPVLEDTSAVIGVVRTNSTAYAEGIRRGDVITKVNETPVSNWMEFMIEGMLGADKNQRINLTLMSNGTNKTINIETSSPKETGFLVEGVWQAVPCLLGLITSDSPAEKAGLKANDIVMKVDETPIVGWAHFTEVVQLYSNKTANITVMRDHTETTISITPEYDRERQRVLVGVGLGSFREKPSDQLKGDATMLSRTLKGLLNPNESKKVAKNIEGPIGIFKWLWRALVVGILPALGLIRLININLAVLNLLPIPVLDGGHICFALWEGITKRKVHPKLIASLVNTFAILLITLMLILSWRDAGGERLIKLLKKAPAEQVESPAD